MIRLKNYLITAVVLIAVMVACNEWDEHNKPSHEALNESLLQVISKTPELARFSEYLVATGYDKVLASSKAFTVWAPDNQALEALPAEIANDAEKLKRFIGNHISYQEYFTESASPLVRIKMINGKNLTWYGNRLESAGVVSANQYTRNGVLHIINGPVTPRENSWELLLASLPASKHSAYLQSLTYEQFVDSLANQTGIDPATGKPIYEPGTGIVIRNRFLDEAIDISNEDSLHTFIVLNDNAFDKEFLRLEPYFTTVTGNQDSTTSLASWHLAKDLVVRGLFTPDALPDTLVSKYGVKVPIDKTAIVETHLTSNGIVYVMNKVSFRLKDKFPPMIIQGERPDGFSRNDKNLNIHYRYRNWADGGFDLRVWNHGISQFNVRYKIDGLYSMNYKVYWRTVNDFVDTTFTNTTNDPPYANVASFQQKLVFDLKNIYVAAPAPKRDFGYVKVNRIKPDPANNRLTYLGDYKHDHYRSLYLFVIANSVASPHVLNPIEIDYIKLVPIPIP